MRKERFIIIMAMLFFSIMSVVALEIQMSFQANYILLTLFLAHFLFTIYMMKYDLQGRKIGSNAAHGIYIREGKKTYSK